MSQPEVSLDEQHQLTVIESICDACQHIACRLHFVATDPTHVHVLVSWNDDKSWQQKRNSIKRRITIDLKSRHEALTWLSDGSSRKRVRNRTHFEYLMGEYLPSHCGWKWSELRELFFDWHGGEA